MVVKLGLAGESGHEVGVIISSSADQSLQNIYWHVVYMYVYDVQFIQQVWYRQFKSTYENGQDVGVIISSALTTSSDAWYSIEHVKCTRRYQNLNSDIDMKIK